MQPLIATRAMTQKAGPKTPPPIKASAQTPTLSAPTPARSHPRTTPQPASEDQRATLISRAVASVQGAQAARRGPAQPNGQKADPAPSRAAYRMQRIMLTPAYRLTIRILLPFLFAMAVTAIYLSDEGRRDNLLMSFYELRNDIQTRPEFMVKLMAVDGASDETEADIREIVQIDFPISTFDLDLDAMRENIQGLPSVAHASARIRQQGVLEVAVTERDPALLWRGRDGIRVLDKTGIEIAELDRRSDRPDLPVVAGFGANTKTEEALNLLQIAAPFADRLRGLERIGNRRWDVVLYPDIRIMLPDAQPDLALERAIALHDAQDVLNRDIAALDLRLAARPTIRMNAPALERWRQIKDVFVGTGDR
ncbi:cell division protein FtsQ/DivIB [Pseudooceanicola sp. MF1-13]|uniref:cell division protein FtsQ/DivIB n=1 Tax=Pseudooceanicola sp. MF1-13 TaxID=3379095 RepID=UPI003892C5C7